MKKRKIPLQGKGRQFRADLWLDEKITGRTLNALQQRGIRFPENINPRKTAEFKAEYQRQLAQFRNERAAKKKAQRAAQQETPADKPAQEPSATSVVGTDLQ